MNYNYEKYNFVSFLKTMEDTDPNFIEKLKIGFLSFDKNDNVWKKEYLKSFFKDFNNKLSTTSDYYELIFDAFFTDVYLQILYDPEYILGNLTYSVDGDYVLINYSREIQFWKKWCGLTMTTRWFVFDMRTLEVVAYPFNKFFNAWEYWIPLFNPENFIDSKFHAYEKIDWSLWISYFDKETDLPKITTKGILWSKQGICWTEILMNKYWHIISNYPTLFQEYTFIFEIVSPVHDNEHIIEYIEDDLFLLWIRNINTKSNDYLKLYNQDEVDAIADTYWFKRPLKHNDTKKDILSFMWYVKDLSWIEWFVLYFNDGAILKLKTEEYCLIHAAYFDLTPQQILRQIRDDQLEYYLSILPEEVLAKAEWYSNQFFEYYDYVFNKALEEVLILKNTYTKSEFFINKVDEKIVSKYMKENLYIWLLIIFLYRNIEKHDLSIDLNLKTLYGLFLQKNAIDIWKKVFDL